MAAAGVIVAALIAGITSYVGSEEAAMAQDKTSDEAMGLANIKRKDELAAQAASERAAAQNRALSAQGLAQGERQYQQTFAENKRQNAITQHNTLEDKAYSRKKDVYANALALLNGNMQMQQIAQQYWRQ